MLKAPIFSVQIQPYSRREILEFIDYILDMHNRIRPARAYVVLPEDVGEDWGGTGLENMEVEVRRLLG